MGPIGAGGKPRSGKATVAKLRRPAANRHPGSLAVALDRGCDYFCSPAAGRAACWHREYNILRKFILGLAAAGLVATPVVAQVSRDSAPVVGENGIEASTAAVAFALAAIAVAIFATTGNDDDTAVSP